MIHRLARIYCMLFALALLVGIPCTASCQVETRNDLGDPNGPAVYAIVGRVSFPDGHPVEGLKVTARPSSQIRLGLKKGSAVTDHDGRYAIRELVPIGYFVDVDTKGRPIIPTATQRVAQWSDKSTKELDFVVTPGPEVTVRFKDADTGKPVKGMQVFEQRSQGAAILLGETDANGLFRHRFLSLTFGLSVADPSGASGYFPVPRATFSRSIDLPKSEDIEWSVDALGPGFEPRMHKVKGVVVDREGRVVPGAVIRFPQNPARNALTANERGEFSFSLSWFGPSGMPPMMFVVSKGGQGAFKMATGGELWNGVRVAIAPKWCTGIKGRIVDEHGAPVVNLPVSVGAYSRLRQEYPSGPSVDSTTDAQGRFEIKGLDSQGLFVLVLGDSVRCREFGLLRLPLYRPEGAYLSLPPGEIKDLGVVLIPRANKVVAGTVHWVNGNLAAGLLIYLHGGHTSLFTNADKNGYFKFPAVVDEPLTLEVSDCHVGGGDKYIFSGKVTAGDEHVAIAVRKG